MPTRRSAQTTPDLFSAAPVPKAPEPRAVPQGKALADNAASQARYVLPKDLAGALKRLDDTELDALLVAVTGEAERRGRLPRLAGSNTTPGENVRSSLTKGKLNAVRAAFKAGVKPAAIARQFGISQADVRSALTAEGRHQKSRR